MLSWVGPGWGWPARAHQQSKQFEGCPTLNAYYRHVILEIQTTKIKPSCL